MSGAVRVDHATASGTFSLDGEVHEVENNIWVVGDDTECVVIDAPHSVEAISSVVGERKVKAILLTHAHDDHCKIAPALREAVVAPIFLNPADRPLWEYAHPQDEDGNLWDLDLPDGWSITVGEGDEAVSLTALHTPGHAPGSTCFHSSELGCVFTGDTLFNGGPGATGRSYSDRPLLEASIRERLFVLPEETVVHTGHGDDTTIGAEKAASADW
ncbi:MBL fold metallo-hydrolase [Nocardioides flavescens]|uniref:MBL fold metallo-hydrolase n=1 Tax=Nocardioides flavescens TaxID=2691959 RepID=A0A6L7EUN0_9ACTN|nr:MBL fold metallo-hydrolase [Nocardioides flavescens]